MTTAEALIADINERVAYISTQVRSGDRDAVSAEQARALLATFSQLKGIELDVVTAVSKHLQDTGAWDRDKLAAFSTCLRAALGNRLHQPGVTRAMQICLNLIHYFPETDWKQLCDKSWIDVGRIQETVACRMHRYGLVCPDANTLRIASAIVQACSDKRPTDEEKRAWAFEIKDMLKKLDREDPWPFEYIRRYPGRHSSCRRRSWTTLAVTVSGHAHRRIRLTAHLSSSS